MELLIAENFRITSDPMNTILQERKLSKPTDKNPDPVERWDNIGYFATVVQASLAYKKIKEKDSEATEISGFITDLLAIEDRIIQAVGQWQKPTLN